MNKTAPLHCKQMTRKPQREQLVEFEYLINICDMDGIRDWHRVNTPWCSEQTIQSYIDRYKEAIEDFDHKK